ncbi:hypothetical protein [Methylopila sp. M107]|uniref:hypothetical protein n=1 Tax=Methylopila sp. M107 TaxID=1101190 RepID=UPI00036E56AB|nr:hypothetical protein [Methylopila sp. M107]
MRMLSATLGLSVMLFGVFAPAARAADEMIYTPIQPCRAFSTSSAVAAGQTRNFQITGSGSLTSQGGPASGCGVPAYAKAVSVNLSAVNPTAAGYLRSYATGATPPGTTVVSYRSGANATAGATVALNSSGQMAVFVGGAAKVVGDITGYLAPQMWANVNYLGGVQSSSGRVNSTVRAGTGIYYVTFDREIGSCSAMATSGDAARITSVFLQTNYVTVYIYSTAGTLVDGNFVVSVKC